MLKNFVASLYNRLPLIRELKQIQQTLNLINSNTSVINHTISQIKNFQIIDCLDSQFNQYKHDEDNRRLQRYSFQVNSQNGEDGIIHEIFKRIGTTDKTFVEIGIGDGTSIILHFF